MRTIKVEINGVNTAELPVLSAKEQGEMIRKIKEGHTELKQKFINTNLRLVLSLVKKFNHRYFGPWNIDPKLSQVTSTQS